MLFLLLITLITGRVQGFQPKPPAQPWLLQGFLLSRTLLQSLLAKQILHLPHYQVEFGAVLLPLQVSQQWVCSSLQGSKTSCEGGAGRSSRSSRASCQEGCAAPGMAELGSHEQRGRIDAWRWKGRERRERKGRNRKKCRKTGLKKIRYY